jgi:rhodanese-related sulfurtransferase
VSFLLENWMLILLALVSGTLLVAPQLAGAGASSVGTSEAVRLINREKAVLIDVCEPNEFAAGHAAGARNVPLASLETSKELPSNKALPLVLMCASGSRSKRAAATLKKLGYEKAVAVAGGTAAWREASLPIDKKAS